MFLKSIFFVGLAAGAFAGARAGAGAEFAAAPQSPELCLTTWGPWPSPSEVTLMLRVHEPPELLTEDME